MAPRPSRCAVVLLALLGLGGAACSEGAIDDPAVPAEAAEGGTAGRRGRGDDSQRASTGIVWSPCTLYSPGSLDDYGTAHLDRTDAAAECGIVELPLDHDAPGGETLAIFVKHLPARAPPARAQLWMLQGGPGGTSIDLEALVGTLTSLDAGVEVFLLDQRGTGRSTRLGCAAQESPKSLSSVYVDPAEIKACAETVNAAWSPAQLAHFDTTSAARDVGALIGQTRVPGRLTYVYGVSYGSFLAQRYLQLFPSQADGVVLDSIVPPVTSLTTFDVGFDQTAKQLLEACKDAPACAKALGPDPWARMTAVLDQQDVSPCTVPALGLTSRAGYVTLFGQMLTGWYTRELIPAIVHRAERCTTADKKVLLKLGQTLYQVSQSPPEGVKAYSIVLGSNVALSELWTTPAPTLEELEDVVLHANASTGAGPLIARWQGALPRYPHDAYWGRLATTTTPLLMMHGTIDPRTALSSATQVGEHFAGPHQTFVVLPRASHAVVINSPTIDGGTTCGLELLRGFLMDPRQPIDTSCVERIRPLDFQGEPSATMTLLGTTDAWGDGDAPTGPLPPPSAPSALALASLRQRGAGTGIAPLP